MDGGAGDDLVEGGFGDDKLTGGPGRDTVNGDRKSRCNEYHCDYFGAGNDTIEVRDGEVDSVTCGVGTDRVVADTIDVVAADCETVERAAPPGGGPETKTSEPQGEKLTVKKVKLAKALKSGLSVTVSGVTGKVKLTAKQGKKTVASGTATASQRQGDREAEVHQGGQEGAQAQEDGDAEHHRQGRLDDVQAQALTYSGGSRPTG